MAGRVNGGAYVKLFHCESQNYLGCLNDESSTYELKRVGMIERSDNEDESYDTRSLWRIDYLLDKSLQVGYPSVPLSTHKLFFRALHSPRRKQFL